MKRVSADKVAPILDILAGSALKIEHLNGQRDPFEAIDKLAKLQKEKIKTLRDIFGLKATGLHCNDLLSNPKVSPDEEI